MYFTVQYNFSIMGGVFYPKLAGTRCLLSPLFRDHQELPGHSRLAPEPKRIYNHLHPSMDRSAPGSMRIPILLSVFVGQSIYGV